MPSPTSGLGSVVLGISNRRFVNEVRVAMASVAMATMGHLSLSLYEPRPDGQTALDEARRGYGDAVVFF